MIIFIGVLFGLDQKTKTWAIHNLRNQAPRRWGYLDLRYVENRGATLGFLSKYPRLLKGLHILTIVLLIYLLVQEKKALTLRALAYMLIISGGFGNLYDRLKRNYVVDFFSSHHKRVPYFNLADIYVIAGVVVMLIGA